MHTGLQHYANPSRAVTILIAVRKGKESKSQYLCTSYTTSRTLKALRHGSHSFTCKLHYACPFPNSSLLLIYRLQRDERLSLPGWLTYSGQFILISTRQLHVERRTGKVRRPKIDISPLCYASKFVTHLWQQFFVMLDLCNDELLLFYCTADTVYCTGRWHSSTGKVTTGLAESTGSLPLGWLKNRFWADCLYTGISSGPNTR